MALKNRLRKLEKCLGKGPDQYDVRALINLLTEFRLADLDGYINLAWDLSGWPRCNFTGDSVVRPVRAEEKMESILCSGGHIRQVDVGPFWAFLQRREEAKNHQGQAANACDTKKSEKDSVKARAEIDFIAKAISTDLNGYIESVSKLMG
jgi:hypothetical protein